MKILLILLTYVVIANTFPTENISRKIQKKDTQIMVLHQQIKEALLKGTLNEIVIEQVKQAILNGHLNEIVIEQVKQAILNGHLNEIVIEQVKQAILNGHLNGTGLYELLNMTTPTSPQPPYRRTLAHTLTIETIPRKRQKRNTQDEQIKQALINGTLNDTMREYVKEAIKNGTLNETIIEQVKQAILNGTVNGTGLYELLNITAPPPPTRNPGVTLPFDFWRPVATKASEIMNTLFQDSKFIYQQSEAHIKHVFMGLWRMGFIMWLGICQSTTSTTPLPTGWMREKLEKYYGKNFMDYGFG